MITYLTSGVSDIGGAAVTVELGPVEGVTTNR